GHLDGFLDQPLLLLEAVRLGEEDVLRDDLEIVSANLPKALERYPFRIDEDHLASGAHDVPRELQAEVRLSAPRFPVQERDAAVLDSPTQEVVQGAAAQGHLHCSDNPVTPFNSSRRPPATRTGRRLPRSRRRPRARSVPSAAGSPGVPPRSPDGSRSPRRMRASRSVRRTAPPRDAARSAPLSP